MRLKLQGSIVGEWAQLLVEECRRFIEAGVTVLLDCADVTYVNLDDARDLGEFPEDRLRIVNASPLIIEVLEEARRRNGSEEP